MGVDLNSYGGLTFDRGMHGQVATSAPHSIRSKRNESATAIQFGRVVARGADGGVVPLSSSALVVAGISLKNVEHPITPAGLGLEYAQNEFVPVLDFGDLYATAAEAANDGDQVIAIVAGGGTLGASKGGIADGTTRITVPFASWDGAVTAGAMGKIKVSIGATITATS
jgi:hypothetical protein